MMKDDKTSKKGATWSAPDAVPVLRLLSRAMHASVARFQAPASGVAPAGAGPAPNDGHAPYLVLLERGAELFDLMASSDLIAAAAHFAGDSRVRFVGARDQIGTAVEFSAVLTHLRETRNLGPQTAKMGSQLMAHAVECKFGAGGINANTSWSSLGQQGEVDRRMVHMSDLLLLCGGGLYAIEAKAAAVERLAVRAQTQRCRCFFCVATKLSTGVDPLGTRYGRGCVRDKGPAVVDEWRTADGLGPFQIVPSPVGFIIAHPPRTPFGCAHDNLESLRIPSSS
jgi:hypothetical protein